VLVENGESLKEEGLEPTVGLAVENDWPDDNKLVVDLISQKIS
jgi:hypothetical protein